MLKTMNFPKSGKEIQSVATTGHVAQPLIVSSSGYGENSPVAKRALSIWVHGPLSLLKYLRKKYYCKCCQAFFKMGRSGGWNSCPGPVSHPRASLRAGKTKLPLPDGRLSQSQPSLGCRAAVSRTNAVEAVRGRSSVLLLAFFREEQKLAYCLMKARPSFCIYFLETG